MYGSARGGAFRCCRCGLGVQDFGSLESRDLEAYPESEARFLLLGILRDWWGPGLKDLAA